jgi:hypothetical protein
MDSLIEQVDATLEREMLRKPTNYHHNEINKKLFRARVEPNANQTVTIYTRKDCSVQTIYPLCEFSGVGYFELTVGDIKNRGMVAIGLARPNYPSKKQPGWESHSWAYHSDDGKKFNDSGQGIPYGPTFTSGDVIGCGFIWRTKQIFFTKNAEKLAIAFSNVDPQFVFPTIGLDHSSVTCNFSPPFKFDLEQLEREEKENNTREMLRTKLPVDDTIPQIIMEYLIQEGYYGTFNALNRETELPEEKLPQLNGLQFRNQVIQYIIQGDILTAKHVIDHEMGAEFLRFHSQLEYILNCLQFIQIVLRGGQNMVTESIEYARENLQDIHQLESDDFDVIRLEEVIGILAYNNPFESPLRHLVCDEHRANVAQQVNKFLLKNYRYRNESRNSTKRRRVDCSIPLTSSLERICQQTAQTYSCLRLSDMKLEKEFPDSD